MVLQGSELKNYVSELLYQQMQRHELETVYKQLKRHEKELTKKYNAAKDIRDITDANRPRMLRSVKKPALLPTDLKVDTAPIWRKEFFAHLRFHVLFSLGVLALFLVAYWLFSITHPQDTYLPYVIPAGIVVALAIVIASIFSGMKLATAAAQDAAAINERNAQENKKRLAAYQREQKAADAENQKKLRDYNANLRTMQTLDLQIAQLKHDATEVAKSYWACDGMCKKMEALQVLHPKYSGWEAMARICEYLELGRCTALESTPGMPGAYELLARDGYVDAITARLDNIEKQLHAIAQNQRFIADGITSMSRQLDNIYYNSQKNLEKLEQQQAALAGQQAQLSAQNTRLLENTALTNHYSKQLAENAEIMKNITIWEKRQNGQLPSTTRPEHWLGPNRW